MIKAHEMRYNILRAMDTTIHNHTNDECYIKSWLKIVPKNSTNLDFQNYTKNEEEYVEFVETFHRLLYRMDKDPHELTRNDLIGKFIEYLGENRHE